MAREALVRLSPVSAAAVDDDWRDQLADYLLNQQSGPEATATRGHLRRSEAARGWARSVEDSLEHLYDDGNAAGRSPRASAGEPSGARRQAAAERRERIEGRRRHRRRSSRPRRAARSAAGG